MDQGLKDLQDLQDLQPEGEENVLVSFLQQCQAEFLSASDRSDLERFQFRWKLFLRKFSAFRPERIVHSEKEWLHLAQTLVSRKQPTRSSRSRSRSRFRSRPFPKAASR